MNDWYISVDGVRPEAAVDYDWTRIDQSVRRLARLQHQAQNSGVVSDELQSCFSEFEQLLAEALEQRVTVSELAERAEISQQDLIRVRETGRLYER